MDRTPLRRFQSTSVALALAFMVLVLAAVWDLGKFDLPGIDALSIDKSEIDLVAMGFLLVIPAFFLDRAVARQRTNEDERVQCALGVARMGVWEWDLNSDAVTWSSTTASMFGLSPEEAPATGHAFFELVHPDDREALEADDRALREGTDLTSEFRILSSNGRVRWLQSRGRITRDTSGKSVRILGVNIDITDRKRLEGELLEARLQAEQLRVLRVTMRTVQDIVNNNLNQLSVLRMEAEGHVSDETLALFDKTIQDTASQLTAIGEMEAFAEKPMASGSGLDVGSSSVS